MRSMVEGASAMKRNKTSTMCAALRPAPPPPRKSAVPLPRFHGGGWRSSPC
jgi:hypothetical protein